MTPDEMREQFHALQVALGALQRDIAQAPLPDYFDVPCGCDSEALQVIEHGYERWEDVDGADYPARLLHATTNGWASMSEQGYVEYLECSTYKGGCGKIWAMPENVDWD